MTSQAMPKVIDFELRGNVARFAIGAPNSGDWYGDDWDDAPYEHNAEEVYDKFVTGFLDLSFSFDSYVCEPCTGELNSRWRKDDMKAGRVPMVVVVPPAGACDEWGNRMDSFTQAVAAEDAVPVYMGEGVNRVLRDLCRAGVVTSMAVRVFKPRPDVYGPREVAFEALAAPSEASRRRLARQCADAVAAEYE